MYITTCYKHFPFMGIIYSFLVTNKDYIVLLRLCNIFFIRFVVYLWFYKYISQYFN